MLQRASKHVSSTSLQVACQLIPYTVHTTGCVPVVSIHNGHTQVSVRRSTVPCLVHASHSLRHATRTHTPSWCPYWFAQVASAQHPSVLMLHSAFEAEYGFPPAAYPLPRPSQQTCHPHCALAAGCLSPAPLWAYATFSSSI